jgi:hypothetical protein
MMFVGCLIDYYCGVQLILDGNLGLVQVQEVREGDIDSEGG